MTRANNSNGATSRKPTVHVIGAGFSGLATSYFLVKNGVPVRLSERGARAGGLIGTKRAEHGLVETAANGFINSARLEALCADLNVPLAATLKTSRARYLWRNGGPRRWPLGLGESLRLSGALARYLTGRWRPRPQESVAAWGARVLGAGATNFALVPVLSGIYAGDANRLSASLIFNRYGAPAKAPKPSRRGTVAPPGGMQQIIEGLTAWLQQRGVAITYNQEAEVKPGEPTVVATSGASAAEIVRSVAPEVSDCLRKIELLPILTATAFFAPNAQHPAGFGCLFPRGAGFRARGALFNDCIFAGRSAVRSETWIFGGGLDPAVVALGDRDLADIIADEHARLTGVQEQPLSLHITRWPRALPHYTLELETALARLPELPRNLALVGNYLGEIGLTKILDRAERVAARVTQNL